MKPIEIQILLTYLKAMKLAFWSIALFLKEIQYGAWSVTNANTFVKTEMQTK